MLFRAQWRIIDERPGGWTSWAEWELEGGSKTNHPGGQMRSRSERSGETRLFLDIIVLFYWRCGIGSITESAQGMEKSFFFFLKRVLGWLAVTSGEEDKFHKKKGFRAGEFIAGAAWAVGALGPRSKDRARISTKQKVKVRRSRYPKKTVRLT